MSDKPKENRCGVIFLCADEDRSPCAYFSTNNKGNCRYAGANVSIFPECKSSVANVNRMTIELKKLKGEI